MQNAQPLPLSPPGPHRWLAFFLAVLWMVQAAAAQPAPAAVASYQAIADRAGQRLLAPGTPEAAPPTGAVQIERLSPPPDTAPGALIHHWRATAWLPGVSGSSVQQLLLDLPAYPRVFAPEVLASRITAHTPDGVDAVLRFEQHHVLTVTLDAAFQVRLWQPAPGYSVLSSRSTHISEVAGAGTPGEHPLAPADAHGFLLAQSTFWALRDLPGGVLVTVESVSLSRSVPTGLGWAVRPLVDSVPRESMLFTLHAVMAALQPPAQPPVTLTERTSR